MKTNMVWNAIAAFCLVAGTSVSARVCVLTTEPDRSVGGRVRFVLPPGDHCSCTQVVLGGHNTYAPPRKDQPVYIDTLPMDVEGLRRSQGCPNESPQSEDLKKTSTSQYETSDTPITSEAQTMYTDSTLPDETSDTPITSEAQIVYTYSTLPGETSETPVASGAPVAYKDCQDARKQGKTTSGVYTIEQKEKTFRVYCDMETPDEGYIVIQRRYDGLIHFNRSWDDYKAGFGDLDGEFWLGNDKLHKITYGDPVWELIVTLTAFGGSVAKVRYDKFIIKEEKDHYEIDVSFGGFEAGDVTDNNGDGLESKKFSTFDKDNDDDDDNCAKSLGGGWWFSHCHDTLSNLNGFYYNTAGVTRYRGIYWSPWKADESLKATEMKIRQLM